MCWHDCMTFIGTQSTCLFYKDYAKGNYFKIAKITNITYLNRFGLVTGAIPGNKQTERWNALRVALDKCINSKMHIHKNAQIKSCHNSKFVLFQRFDHLSIILFKKYE